MSEHPDRIAILMYAEADPSIDRSAIAAHIAGCSHCQEIAHDFQQIILFLSDGEVLTYVTEPDEDRVELRTRLLDELVAVENEWSTADVVLTDLLDQPIETWDSFFEQHPEHRTHGMARRLFGEVEAELNRRPEQALLLVAVAERIANALSDIERRSVLGDVWKHRSNAFRHLGRYEEALAAAERAEALYASLLTGAFDTAQAQYTRAVALFKMTRLLDALQVLALARTTLRDFGESVPLAKTMMLEAAILLEQGDVARAQQRWREVMPTLARLGDDVEQARVLANLAECNLRLGQFEDAMKDAEVAVHRYHALGMDAEAIRAEWTIGMIHIARGECDEGVSVLESAAAKFAMRGMNGDAGFVKLDITEELLRREEWAEAEVIARDLAGLFSASGVTLASVSALDYLRQAVENREATAEVVRYVRVYVTVDDPTRPFAPPHAPLN